MSLTLNYRILSGNKRLVFLKLLNNEGPMTGTDIQKRVHKEFGRMISSGTIWGTLRDMQIEGETTKLSNRKFAVTGKGATLLLTASIDLKILSKWLNTPKEGKTIAC